MNAIIQNRADAVACLKDIRTLRARLFKEKFTAELFNEINDPDYALEGLIGHSVALGVLDEQGLLDLRREIMSALNVQELEALDTIREDLRMILNPATEALAPVATTKFGLKLLHMTDEKFNEIVDAKPLISQDDTKTIMSYMTEFCSRMSAVSASVIRLIDEGGDDPEEIPAPDKQLPDITREIEDAKATVDEMFADWDPEALKDIKSEENLKPGDNGFTKENIKTTYNEFMDASNAFEKEVTDFINLFALDTAVADVHARASVAATESFQKIVDKIKAVDQARRRAADSLVGAIDSL